ncbi:MULTISPECIES: hypothetical protein [unclassified Bradyrhizobium]|uniref:hypothetical protein n=1 Tax=unclassified Bradyrhizobium TaxID=2631580 RepID=UPI0024865643|nr:MULTISPECIES: hypothetical protein [unclassified Bradyrhizobium]MDI2060718.1 hypothetical protein [Bradyrhizobium sp. Mp19]MDI2110914.1 hypothetical protein [Bradyrhizobium sp. Mp64]
MSRGPCAEPVKGPFQAEFGAEDGTGAGGLRNPITAGSSAICSVTIGASCSQTNHPTNAVSFYKSHQLYPSNGSNHPRVKQRYDVFALVDRAAICADVSIQMRRSFALPEVVVDASKPVPPTE